MSSVESGGARIDYTVHGDGSSSSSVMLTPIWRRGMRLVRLLAAMGRVDRTLSPPDLALLNDHVTGVRRSVRAYVRCFSSPVPKTRLSRNFSVPRPEPRTDASPEPT